MAGVGTQIGAAAASHRRAVALASALETALDVAAAFSGAPAAERGVRELAERLRVAASLLAPGWLGAPLDAAAPSTPLGLTGRPEVVRIGTAYPLDDASFPVVVPMGHLAVDADARDPRVAGLLRALLLRLIASEPAGSLYVRTVDAVGGVFAGYEALDDAGVLPPPVSDRPGLCDVLTEAEEWVRHGPASPGAGTRLLVVASWPQTTEPVELARFSALASNGPAAGLHLILTGWPPLLLGEDSTEPVAISAGRSGPPLQHATKVTLRNPYAVVSDPTGGSFSSVVPAGQQPTGGLNSRVFLDEAPSPELIGRVCRDVAAQVAERARGDLGPMLPDGPLWQQSAESGVELLVGSSGGQEVRLRLTARSPHLVVAGEPGSGRTALLLDILYGLCARYSPWQVRCELLDLTGDGSFADFVPRADDPSYLPHAHTVAVRPNHTDAVAVLRGLVDELARRRSAETSPMPRAVCVIDGLDQLLAEDQTGEVVPLLEELALQGGEYGIHLLLAGEEPPPEQVAAHCPLRIALPGGARNLDSDNHAADTLELGTAVVNTASGLGGPDRARRAHEQLVRFPNPYPHRAVLAGLRHRMWRARGGAQ